jgi:hypothetical protein
MMEMSAVPGDRHGFGIRLWDPKRDANFLREGERDVFTCHFDLDKSRHHTLADMKLSN